MHKQWYHGIVMSACDIYTKFFLWNHFYDKQNVSFNIILQNDLIVYIAFIV